jgi:hypothetical protein
MLHRPDWPPESRAGQPAHGRREPASAHAADTRQHRGAFGAQPAGRVAARLTRGAAGCVHVVRLRGDHDPAGLSTAPHTDVSTEMKQTAGPSVSVTWSSLHAEGRGAARSRAPSLARLRRRDLAGLAFLPRRVLVVGLALQVIHCGRAAFSRAAGRRGGRSHLRSKLVSLFSKAFASSSRYRVLRLMMVLRHGAVGLRRWAGRELARRACSALPAPCA